MKFAIEIAGTVFGLETIYNDTYELCKGYFTGKTAEKDIVINKSDVEKEQIRADETNRKEGTDCHYTDGYLETLAVYRKICDYLAGKNVILFHSSAIETDGEAYLFTAPSGTGKSTHARLWREYLGDRAKMINDDKPLIKITADRAFVYGTPWDGKHRLSRNVSVPVKAVCFLERGSNNVIEKVNEGIIPGLFAQTYRPEGKENLATVLNSVIKLTSLAEFYRLKCNMEPEAARVAYEAMSGKE